MNSDAGSGQEGSMLIESLVAFVILAAATTISFQVLGEGVKRLEATTAQTEPLWRAYVELASLRASNTPFRERSYDRAGLSIQVERVGAAKDRSVQPFVVRIWKSGGIEGSPPLVESIVLRPADADD